MGGSVPTQEKRKKDLKSKEIRKYQKNLKTIELLPSAQPPPPPPPKTKNKKTK